MDWLWAIIALITLALASQFWGAESRPGFVEGPSDRVEHWFTHSKEDLA